MKRLSHCIAVVDNKFGYWEILISNIIGEQKRILRGFACRKRENLNYILKNNKNFDIKIFVVWKNFPNRDDK